MFSGVQNGGDNTVFPLTLDYIYIFCFLYNPMSVHMDSSLSHHKPMANSRKLNQVGTGMALEKGLYLERKEENGVGLDKTEIRVSFLCPIQICLYINNLQSGEQIPKGVVEMMHCSVATNNGISMCFSLKKIKFNLLILNI